MPEEMSSLMDFVNAGNGTPDEPVGNDAPNTSAAPPSALEASAASSAQPAAATQATDEWPSFDEQADPFEQFKDPAALEAAAKDPAQLYARAQAAETLLRSNQERLAAFNEIEEQAKTYLGEARFIPFAMEVVGNLFGGAALDPSQPAPMDTFLEKVQTTDPQTYERLLVTLAKREIEPLLETLAPQLMQRLGLRADLLEAYKAVTITGSYTQGQDVQAEREFLARQPKEWHDAFRNLPAWRRDKLLGMPDEEAHYELSRDARAYALDQREAQAKAAEAEAQQYEQSIKVSEAIDTEYTDLFDHFVKQGETLKLDPVRAHGIAAMAYMEFHRQQAEERKAMRATDRINATKFERAVMEGNQFAITKARDAAKLQISQIFRNIVAQHGKRPAPGTTAQQGQPGVNGSVRPVEQDRQPQFDADRPASGNKTPDLLDLIVRQNYQANGRANDWQRG